MQSWALENVSKVHRRTRNLSSLNASRTAARLLRVERLVFRLVIFQ